MGGVEWAKLFGNLKGLSVGAIGITETEAAECVENESFGESGRGGNFGKLLAKGFKGAAVETGDKHFVCHVVLANEGAKCGGDVGVGLFDFDNQAVVG